MGVVGSTASVPSVSRTWPIARASTPTTITVAAFDGEVGLTGRTRYRFRPKAPVGWAVRVPASINCPIMKSSKSLGL